MNRGVVLLLKGNPFPFFFGKMKGPLSVFKNIEDGTFLYPSSVVVSHRRFPLRR